MTRRKRILLIPILVGSLALFVWLSFPSEEATYQGKPVSAWLDEFNRPRTGLDTGQRDMALFAFGPKAVPYLVRRLKRTDSAFYQSYTKRFPKLPSFLAKVLPKPNAMDWTSGGNAFLAIGSPIEPDLVALLADSSHSVREAAAFALGSLKRYHDTDIRNAVAALTHSLSDEYPAVRFFSAQALSLRQQSSQRQKM